MSELEMLAKIARAKECVAENVRRIESAEKAGVKGARLQRLKSSLEFNRATVRNLAHKLVAMCA